ncbi:hypothetical protein TWF970_006331 [Orbilia oligospora]|uniref:Rhodopsin domain-containing protein n=1 Tax=Orbilia oligospora TaxID=2813651 RepID=A0A7C8V6I2_ORBOL|nr:hypothetical protein TWF970_006331 [Orbilia oligospora]
MTESAAINGSNLGVLTVTTAVVSMILCTTGVVARLLTRLKDANQRLYLEDWILVGPAYICTMGVACTMIAATTYKLGAHVDLVVDIDNIVKLMKTLYALQIALLIALGAIRASLLLFIRRLSKTSSKPIYMITTILVHISTAHITVSIFSSIFRCNPISTIWTPGAVKYTCTNIVAVYVLVSVGLAIDALMFLLPAILVIELHITKKKKIQSLVMFALGGGGCIIEALRFGQLQETKTSPDPIYSAGKVVIFLFIQVVLGMLCCCAPSIKAFGTRVINSKFKHQSFESYSDNIGANIAREIGNTTYPQDNIEIGDNSRFGENSAQSFEGHIEMDTQQNGKDGAAVGGRIMDLKEVLKLYSEETNSLSAIQSNKASQNSRTNSSLYEEFNARPMEWGRQL